MAGIYIHIPFCRQACHYCDFHFSTSLNRKNELVELIGKELDLQRNFFSPGDVIETIYFGGGTPSLLSDDEIKSILFQAKTIFTVSGDPRLLSKPTLTI